MDVFLLSRGHPRRAKHTLPINVTITPNLVVLRQWVSKNPKLGSAGKVYGKGVFLGGQPYHCTNVNVSRGLVKIAEFLVGFDIAVLQIYITNSCCNNADANSFIEKDKNMFVFLATTALKFA